MVFTRNVSPSELIHAGAGCRASDPYQKINQLVVEGEGRIDPQALRDAVAKTAEAIPGCRLVLKGFWGWKKWVADGPQPDVRVVDSQWDGMTSGSADFFDTPLDIFQGPSTEVLLVNAKKTYLVFRTHHAVMDGRGSYLFMLYVLKALRGETLEVQDSPMIDADIFYEMASTELTIKPITDALAPTGKSKGTSKTRSWLRLSIDHSDALMFLKTMHGINQIAREQGSGQVRLDMPVDLRRHKPGVNSTANFASMLIFDLEESDTTTSLAKKVNEAVRGNQELRYPKIAKMANWIPLPLMQRIVAGATQQQIDKKKFMISGIMSHIAQPEPEDISTDTFKVLATFSIPVETYNSPLFVCIWGNENATEIIIGSPDAVATDNRLEIFAEKLKKYL